MEQPEWAFTTGGHAVWSAQTTTTHDSSDAAQSGAIGAGQTSWMQTTVDFPEAGIVSFWGKLSKAAPDASVFYYVFLDGFPARSIEGDWEKVQIWVTAGRHTLLWMLSSASDADGPHTAFLDECSFHEGGFALTVNSTNPGSGADVRVDHADLNGEQHGATPMTRLLKPEYYTLVASPRSGGNYFDSWSGCAESSSTTCVVDPQEDATIAANYGPEPSAYLADAVDQPSWTFSTSPGNTEWYGDTTPGWNVDSIDAARVTAFGEDSSLETTRSIPANGGYITFWWGCNLPQRLDEQVRFFIDDEEQAAIHGYTMYKFRAIPVSEGTRTFRWELDIDSGSPWGSAAVDLLSFTTVAPIVEERVSSIPAGQPVEVTPADEGGEADGTTPFVRSYDAGTPVTLRARTTADPYVFVAWEGCDSTSGTSLEVCETRATGGAPVARYQWRSDIGLAESVNQPAWSFTSEGAAAAWVGRTDQSHDGVGAAVSGRIADGEESFFETRRTFSKNGLLQFWWKVSSQRPYDGLAFYADDLASPRVKIAGIGGWQRIIVPLAAGEHLLRWAYSKDPLGTIEGSDGGWVDEIRFFSEGIPWLQATDGTLVDRIELTWANVAGESGYRVYRRAAGVSEYALIHETGADVVAFADLQGCESAIYEYIVTAILPEGESLTTPSDTGYTSACLPPPGSIAASDGVYADRIRVTWGDVSGHSGFRVYRSQDADSGFTHVGETGAAFRAFDDPASCGESWYYRVRAFNANGESVLSAADRGSTKPCPPSAPSGIAAESGKFQIKVSWADVAGENGYKVYRLDPEAFAYSLVATVGAGVGAYADTLECGSEDYSYKVVAFNASGDSADSPVATAATNTCGLEVDVPAGGEAWETLSPQTIRWSGAVDTGKVKIQLFKGRALISTIASSTPTKSGSFNWVVPGKLKPGNDYRIKISWTSNGAIKALSRKFAVTATTGALAVTHPVEAAEVEQGAEVPIAWKGIHPTGLVKIQLYQMGVLKSTISSSAPNTSSTGNPDREDPRTYNWKVPATLTPGTYQARVTWLSNAGFNGYGRTFTVKTPTLTVGKPDGSVVERGSLQTIAWDGLPPGGSVRIGLYQSGALRSTIVSSTPNNNGEFAWTVPTTLPLSAATEQYTVRVAWLSNPAVYGESSLFAVKPTPGALAVTQPGGDVVQGAVAPIAWDGIPRTGSVRIQLYQGTTLVSTIAAGAPNVEAGFAWKVPATLAPAGPCTVRVTWISDAAFTADSAPFTVVSPVLIVGNPGGSDVQRGSAQTISWTGLPAGGNVKIQLNPGNAPPSTIAASVPNSGTYAWTVPATLAEGPDYLVNVTWLSNPAVYGESSLFAVKPTTGALAVTQPESGDVEQGSLVPIAWTNIPAGGTVRIQLCDPLGVVKSLIASSAPNNDAQSYDWMVPGTLTTGDYKVLVTWLANASFSAYSEKFTVKLPKPDVTQPVTAAVEQGSVLPIAWAGIPRTGNVKILLYQGTTLKSTITSSTPNNGAYDWKVPGTLTPATMANPYKVRVVWISNAAVYDDSAGFTVVQPTLVVTQPTGGLWNQGSTQKLPDRGVTWSCGAGNGNVKIDLYKGKTLYKVLLASTPNDGAQDIEVPALKTTASNFKVKVTWLPNSKVSGYGGEFTVE